MTEGALNKATEALFKADFTLSAFLSSAAMYVYEFPVGTTAFKLSSN